MTSSRGYLQILDLTDPTPPLNTEDIFTFDALTEPIVKVRYHNGSVYAHPLYNLAVWLRGHNHHDPLLRETLYTDAQVAEISERLDAFSFDERLAQLAETWEHKIPKTLAEMHSWFLILPQKDLEACLWAAHAYSFLVFQAVYQAGKQRGCLDIGTLDLFLTACFNGHCQKSKKECECGYNTCGDCLKRYTLRENFAKKLFGLFLKEAAESKNTLKGRHCIGRVLIQKQIRQHYLDDILRLAGYAPAEYLKILKQLRPKKRAKSLASACYLFYLTTLC
jgi:hypothetical protein